MRPFNPTRSLTLMLAVLPAWCFAQAPTSPAAPAPVRTPAQLVLERAPADASILLYTDSLAAVVDNDIARELATFEGPHGEFVRAVREFKAGPTLFALSGVPANPFTWRLTFATFIPDTEDPIGQIGERLVPAVNRLLGGDGVTTGLSLTRDGHFARLTLAMPPITLTLAESEGFVFGSSDFAAVSGWLAGDPPAPSFLDVDDYRKLRPEQSVDVSGLVYVNMRMHTPLIAMTLNEGLPRLGEALQVEKIESVMLCVGRETPPPPPAPEPAGRPEGAKAGKEKQPEPPREIFRVALGVSGTAQPGPIRLLAPSPRPLTLAKFFPAETDFLVSGSLPRGSDLLEDIMSAMRTIDPVITDEYEAERADFRREAGYDFQDDILANFGPEWAIGGQFAEGGISESLFAVRLNDAELFKTHLHRLRGVYGLESTPNTYRGVTVYTMVRKPRPFSYALLDGVLLVTPEPQTLTDAIDAVTDNRSLAAARDYQSIHAAAPARQSRLLYVNLAAMLRLETRPPDTESERAMRDLLRSAPAMGVSMVGGEGVVSLEVVAAGDGSQSTTRPLVKALATIIGEERREAMRMKSMANLRTIAMALHMAANENKGLFPANLDPAVLTPMVADAQAARELLRSPYGEPGTGEGAFYLYRSLGKLNSVKTPAQEPILSEPELRDGLLVVAFVDGHVETVSGERAATILRTMRSGG